MQSAQYYCQILIEFWNFSAEFIKKFPPLNFKEIRPVGTSMTRADRRTEVARVMDAFIDCVKTPNV